MQETKGKKMLGEVKAKRMPKLPGLEKVLLIGSGPIVIGQAAETKLA